MTPNLQQHARRFLAYSSRNRFFCPNTNGTLPSPARNLTLQGRIVAALERKAEITNVLEQWRQQQQGNQLNPSLVRGIVDKLRDSQRFREALEVSEWMMEKKICNLIPQDFTVRFHLIENVLGLEKAEEFFESIPENLRSESVYSCLLSSYARRSENKALDKAESIFKKMRELGLLLRPSPFNSMISLYSSLGNRDKVDEILLEMKESKTELDHLAMNNVLRVYADVTGIETMDKYKREWDGNDNKLKLEARTMDAMANAYEKAGLLLEAIEITTCKKQVYRLWNEYKEKAKAKIKRDEITIPLSLILVHCLESVYSCLLSSYARRSENKALDKAESIFKKMRELGLLLRPSPFNSMISLYSSLGNRDKVDEILLEMKESKTELDHLAMNNVLRVYADVTGIETMDKYKREWDGNDNKLKLEARTMDAMANAYEKAGLLLEAIEITTCKKQVYRLWNEYKEKAKAKIKRDEISSERYHIVISSLLKLEDVKGAEEIYEEWEPEGLEFHSRIPCLLISHYCKENDEVKVREVVNSSRQKLKWMQFEMFKDKLIDFGITCLVFAAFFGVLVLICFCFVYYSKWRKTNLIRGI